MQRASSIHLRNPLVLCKNVSRKKIWTFGFMNWAHHLQIQWQWYDHRIIRCNKSTRQSMRSYNALSALTVISAQSCIVTAAQWNLEKMVAWQGTAPIMFSAIVCYSRVFFTTKHQICHMLFKWSIGPCDSKSKKRHSWLIHSLMDCLDGSPYLTWSMHKIWEHKAYFCILSSWTSFIYPHPQKKPDLKVIHDVCDIQFFTRISNRVRRWCNFCLIVRIDPCMQELILSVGFHWSSICVYVHIHGRRLFSSNAAAWHIAFV